MFTEALTKTRARYHDSEKVLLEQNIVQEIVRTSAESSKDLKERQQVR